MWSWSPLLGYTVNLRHPYCIFICRDPEPEQTQVSLSENRVLYPKIWSSIIIFLLNDPFRGISHVRTVASRSKNLFQRSNPPSSPSLSTLSLLSLEPWRTSNLLRPSLSGLSTPLSNFVPRLESTETRRLRASWGWGWYVSENIQWVISWWIIYIYSWSFNHNNILMPLIGIQPPVRWPPQYCWGPTRGSSPSGNGGATKGGGLDSHGKTPWGCSSTTKWLICDHSCNPPS